MAKCKTCGKSGLFLRLQKGMCSSCLNSVFPMRIGAMEITKDNFLHPEKYEVKEEPLKRELSSEIDGKITASNGTKIEVGLFVCPYGIEGIAVIDNHFYEITSSENIKRAKADIISINARIRDAKRYCKTIPDYEFNESRLSFKFNPYSAIRRYSILSFAPLTKSGKVSLNPTTLHINYSDELHGKIMYNRAGSVNRIEIITSETKQVETNGVIKGSCTIHELVFVKREEEIITRFIYRNKNGTKTKVYDSET